MANLILLFKPPFRAERLRVLEVLRIPAVGDRAEHDERLGRNEVTPEDYIVRDDPA